MSLREAKKQRTRQQILATAEAMFRKRGYERTPMREVAARLRLSPQTLYNYFPSKEGILTAIFAERMRTMAAAAEQLRTGFLASKDSAEDPVERFLEVVRWGLRALDQDRDFMRVVYLNAMAMRGSVGPSAPLRADDEFYAAQEANNRVLDHIFKDMQQAGALRSDVEPREIVELYVLIFSDRVTHWLNAGDSDIEALEARAIGSLETLFRGLRTT